MTSTAYRTIPGADRTFSSVSLYFQVARLMVKVHQISPELAAYHAFQMDEAELNRRLRMYEPYKSEMELSAAGPNLEGLTSLPSRVGDAPNDDGRLAALNCVPDEAVPEFEYCLSWFRRIVAEAERVKESQ